jgi:head-tail adaptor
MSGGELAGRLRSRVAIERRDAARDALGGASGEWTPIGHAWADLAPHGTGDAVVGDARGMAARWQVTLRAGQDVGVGDRLVWRGRRLRVRRRIESPAFPDRITIEAEEER